MVKRFGFTLAEVLITLGIIGVVAAMTIPTLMNQTGQAEFKTGLKKAISVLNQAVTMNVALNSTDFSGLSSGNAAGTSVYGMLVSRLNVISTGANATIGGPFNAAANYTLFLNDGMAITFNTTATGCASFGLGATAATCRMVVDVNGVKTPNRLSLSTPGSATAGIFDQFVVDFYNSQVLPHDTKADYILFNN